MNEDIYELDKENIHPNTWEGGSKAFMAGIPSNRSQKGL
jgi:hypothetical protein